MRLIDKLKGLLKGDKTPSRVSKTYETIDTIPDTKVRLPETQSQKLRIKKKDTVDTISQMNKMLSNYSKYQKEFSKLTTAVKQGFKTLDNGQYNIRNDIKENTEILKGFEDDTLAQEILAMVHKIQENVSGGVSISYDTVQELSENTNIYNVFQSIKDNSPTTPTLISKKTKIARPNVYRYLQKLINQNRIVKVSHGRYSVK